MPEKILVVDDEEDIRRLIDRALTSKGFDVISASSALDALVQLQDNAVKVIITDIRMPGMDGLDLITQVKELNQDAPIIVISGYGDFSTAVEALNRGAFYFINKPFDMKTLQDIVSKGLRFPCAHVGNEHAVPFTNHSLKFEIPPDMNLIEGVSFQASQAVSGMDFDKQCSCTLTPFIIDELLSFEIKNGQRNGDDDKVPVSVDVTSDKVVIEVESKSGVFTKECYPPDLSEIDFANDKLVGMMMVRFFSDELTFSDDGCVARAVKYKTKSSEK